MAAAPWCVVVVRCWVERGELRVRMLMSGDLEGAAVRSSVEGASGQLAAWLTGLLPLADDNSTADPAPPVAHSRPRRRSANNSHRATSTRPRSTSPTRAIAAEPLRESAHRTLIRAHLAEGNRLAAAHQLSMYSRLLDEQLGVPPSAEIQALLRA